MSVSAYTPDHTKILHTAYADFVSRQISRTIHVVQYDDSLPILAVKLFSDGQQYTIPSNADISIKLGKSDGKFVYNPALGCDSDRHIVYFEITYQMVVLAETVSPIIELRIGTSIAASSSIGIIIDRNPIQREDIESMSEWKTIQASVDYAREAVSAAASASASRSAAQISEQNALIHKNSAQSAAINAKTSADSADANAERAEAARENVEKYAEISKKYAVGENGDTENAKYYYERTKNISESFSGALRPIGTVAYTELPDLEDVAEGDMYNISEEFVTDDSFKEGANIVVPCGSNIYKTADGKWDILAGSPVTGIKGSSESTYRKGNVNIHKDDIGLENVDNTSDADKPISIAMQKAMDTHTNNNTIHLTASDRQQFFRGNVEWGWRNPEWTEDVNGWLLPGCYGVSATCTNLPENIAEPWGNLMVFPSMEGRIVQIYNDWNQPDELYYRYGGGTVWSGWKLMLNHSYAMCLDQPGTAAKTATSSNFCLRQYHRMTVYFVNGSNAISTLQINNDAARRVYYKAGGFDKTIPRGCFIDMIYIDGSWYVCGGVEEPAKSVTEAPVKCGTIPNNLKSIASVNDCVFSSSHGGSSLAGYLLANEQLNGNYIERSVFAFSGISGGSSYRIKKSGYYYTQLRAEMTILTFSGTYATAVERVKRLRIYTSPNSQSTTSNVICAESQRANTYEVLKCQTVQYLQEGTVVVPVLQMDSYGSTEVTGTWNFYFEIIPLFVS